MLSAARPPESHPPFRRQVDDMVTEAILGYQGDIYYDGLLKILITS